METKARHSVDSTYVFDNAGCGASARFAALSEMYDPGTIRHLEQCGVSAGWWCLEVGGGGGSIAAWLGECVGPSGRVVVTDIDPRFLESRKLRNVEVWRHNIVTDPLPGAMFDLVHARLVLIHLPERESVLERLVAALKPGGWMVDEDFDTLSLVADPMVSRGEVLLKTQVAMTRLFESRGIRRGFGRLLFGRLRANGLIGVGAEGRMFMISAATPGASLMRANYEQLREAMIEAGYITQDEFEQDLARLEAADFLTPSPIMWAAWGRRPTP